MACKPVKFSDITRDQFQAIRARIAAQARQSINAGDTGSANAEGYEVTWTFSEPDRTLTVQCLKKPFFVSEAVVASKIRDIVEADL